MMVRFARDWCATGPASALESGARADDRWETVRKRRPAGMGPHRGRYALGRRVCDGGDPGAASACLMFFTPAMLRIDSARLALGEEFQVAVA